MRTEKLVTMQPLTGLLKIRLWANSTLLDILVLVKTHWTSSRDWSDGTWHYISAATHQETHAGILVMIRATVCSSQDIAHCSICLGRVIHVRLYTHPRAIDLVTVYQVAGTATSDQIRKRKTIWEPWMLFSNGFRPDTCCCV